MTDAENRLRAFAQEFSIRHYGKQFEDLSSEDRAQVDCAAALAASSFQAERAADSAEQIDARLERYRKGWSECQTQHLL